MRSQVAWLAVAPFAVVAVAASLLSAVPARGQIAGQNVNMVSGTKWPGGDPFLQRQNEPSLAVSSRNPLHLLAGANDYRSVDVPNPNSPDETGDAWLGVFKSFDGGRTWQSTLLPGYPQDQSALGLTFPLKGYSAAADPVVRAGTNGLFYYSGIAFNRGTNLGAVFVSTFIDLDNKENGDVTQGLDPIKLVGAHVIDSGTAGQFLDKPWVTADLPRAGAGQCTIAVSPTQTFPAGNVYLAYAKFTGSTSTKLMFTRSLDCGATWATPVKLSQSNSINQGTAIAVDPLSGAVYVAWRRFATSSQGDAIMVAKSTDFGQTFTKGLVAASIVPFDQGMTPTSIRTESLPTIAVSVDASNTSRVHLAWAARPSAGADARIYLATSLDGVSWSDPVPVDNGPLIDDFGNSFTRGHQFMPQLSFAGGRLMLLYYDTRLDHTLGLFYPNYPFQPDSGGRFYREDRDPRGELLTDPPSVYTPYLDDAGLTSYRHTIDVRVAEAVPSSSPAFTTARVSQPKFGTRGDESGTVQFLQQLQVDPPNLPLFVQGHDPFMGDYIDIAGPVFLPPAASGGAWTYNLAASQSPVFYATWTTNQDVRPPLDGDWTHYTPVGGGGASIYDPTQTTPACTSGQEGMRNQNIYCARITEGLEVSSPQNAKPLSTTLTRAFVVLVRNATTSSRSFRLAIANQPAGGKASFLLHPAVTDPDPLTTLDVTIPARSGIARSVFATSTNPVASITVNVTEVDSLGNAIPGGLAGFVVLNPDGTVAPLANPDGVTGSNTDINLIEIYNPDVSNPDVSNPNAPNPDVSNPDVSNPDVSNPDVSNPDVSNPDISNLTVSSPDVSNSNVANPDVSNPDVSNPDVSNQSVSDATYVVKNTGNTSASYHVKLVGNAPANAHLQLIVSTTYQTPIGVGCQLLRQQQNSVVANVVDPVIEDASDLTDPDITDPSASNATFYLRPGETALVTLRGTVDTATMESVVTQVVPVLIPHASLTYAAPLFVTITALPDATFGSPYSQTLAAIGGTAPYSWGIVSGSLPAGLSLDAGTGQISGTPTSPGSSSLTVQVSDSGSPTGSTTRSLTLTVDKGPTTTAVAPSANPSVTGQPVTFTVTVAATAPGQGTPTATVTLSDGPTALGTATLGGGTASFGPFALAVGTHSITASYGGDVDFLSGASPVLNQVVNRAATATTLRVSPNPSVVGQALTLVAGVAVLSPGSGTATGTVTFTDGATVLGAAQLAAGQASITVAAPTAGAQSIVASYSGDASFAGSTSGAVAETVNKASTVTALVASSNPSAAGQAVTFSATASGVLPGVGTPTGTVTFLDGTTPLATVPLGSAQASFTTSSLAPGVHSITAAYGGDANFLPSSSSTVVEGVTYIFIGFLTPLTTAGTLSSPTFSGSANLGNAIPIKWQLTDGGGHYITSLTSMTSLVAVLNVGCPGTPGTKSVVLYAPTSGATGGSTFRYDSSNNQFIFNWDTSSVSSTGTGCYTIVLQLADGSAAKATIVQLN
ncbi:MAG: hypothetical protein EPN53_07685 [Acidobacteria bacterium]|nr:MAG: hypothetical protein EPN53_07685 [Acidobacteriota bacterium]